MNFMIFDSESSLECRFLSDIFTLVINHQERIIIFFHKIILVSKNLILKQIKIVSPNLLEVVKNARL